MPIDTEPITIPLQSKTFVLEESSTTIWSLVISELQKKEQLQTPENMKQEKNGIFLPKKQRAEYSFKYTSFNTI